jgi:hypothetical protein
MRLYVPLSRQEYEALERLACAERRRPQDQAAVILAKVLVDETSSSRSDHDTPTKDTPRRASGVVARVSA